MMNVPYVVLKYATLLLSFPINNVVEVVLTTLSTIWKSTNNPSHLQGMYKYKNWAKRRYGIYLADSGKLFYMGIALRRETDEYHLP